MYESISGLVDVAFYIVAAIVIVGAIIKMKKSKKK